MVYEFSKNLKTGYLAKYNGYPENEKKILVMRDRGNNELAPSRGLLEDYKNNNMSFHRYKKRFIEEMQNPKSQQRIKKIAKQIVNGKQIRLICFEKHPQNCHRSILKELVEETVILENMRR